MNIHLDKLVAGYPEFALQPTTLTIPSGSFTALIGPNGCGKSTLLKTIANVLPRRTGEITLDGQPLAHWSRKQLAQKLAFLPQNPLLPEGINVERLVSYGRTPYQNFLGLQSPEDRKIVAKAMATVDVQAFARKQVSTLSGGQQQRAFIAMCIAQDTPCILLDEPTSFLDIRYQYDVLCLLSQLHQQGRTCVVVLHDIQQAARFADHLIVMRDGGIYAQGKPQDIVTQSMLHDVYNIETHVYPDPVADTPCLTPIL
jgi:iron complex transport system ATP-binding protein